MLRRARGPLRVDAIEIARAVEAANRGGKDALVPAGLEVTVNGVKATNFRDMPIDLGPSKVVASAPGYVPWTGEVTAKDEAQRVVITAVLARDPPSAIHHLTAHFANPSASISISRWSRARSVMRSSARA